MIKSESEMWFVRFEVTKEAVEEAIHDALDRCVREVTVQIGTAVPCKPDWSPEAAHAKPATGGGTSEA